MGVFRNPELKKQLRYFAAIAAVCVFATWMSAGGVCALYVLAACALCSLCGILFTCRRYRVLAKMSRDIDKLLHGNEQIDLSAYDEGELSVLQSELHKMTVRLREQADRLGKDKRYLSNAIADISHQLRTPLTSANLLCTRLAQPELSPEKRQSALNDLTALLRRIDWLIGALLKMSRLDSGTAEFKKERIAVRDAIRKAAEPLAVPMDLRGLRFTCQIGEETFVGDLAWTAEALGNILKNCMEHTPESGVISVCASENALYTEIVICDTGEGFCREDLPHLFERFYKGKNASENSIGIGLALSRMIVSAQNGTVKAENAPQGAMFTVRFYKSAV